MILSIVTEMCSHHQSILGHFQKENLYLLAVTPYSELNSVPLNAIPT